MGKSLPSGNRLQDIARVISSNRVRQVKPFIRSSSSPRAAAGGGESSEQRRQKLKRSMAGESSNSNLDQQRRLPLADVVADCVKRWFQDTLKEAKAGDTNMQVLVGQMYFSGYGVSKDAQKGRAWISRASRSRSSAWKVSGKRPGYNVSDSDSEDAAGEAE